MGFECGQNYGRLFHVEIAQRLDQAFLARKNFLWSFSAHIRPNNATFAARFEQTKTPAYETQVPKRTHAKRKHTKRKRTEHRRAKRRHAKRKHAARKHTKRKRTERRQAKRRRAKRWHAKRKHTERKHARQPEDDNRNRPLASPARFPPFRQEHRAENEPRNSQRRKNTERHAEAVRIDAQIAARSERHDPDEHRRKQRA